jgi:hypothetical protein
VLWRRGDLTGAEREAREALAAVSSTYPDEWRLGADLRARLADVLIDLRKGEEAEPLTREALDLKRANLGPTHPEVLAAMYQHAEAVDALLRFDEGLRTGLGARVGPRGGVRAGPSTDSSGAEPPGRGP